MSRSPEAPTPEDLLKLLAATEMSVSRFAQLSGLKGSTVFSYVRRGRCREETKRKIHREAQRVARQQCVKIEQVLREQAAA